MNDEQISQLAEWIIDNVDFQLEEYTDIYDGGDQGDGYEAEEHKTLVVPDFLHIFEDDLTQAKLEEQIMTIIEETL